MGEKDLNKHLPLEINKFIFPQRLSRALWLSYNLVKFRKSKWDVAEL